MLEPHDRFSARERGTLIFAYIGLFCVTLVIYAFRMQGNSIRDWQEAGRTIPPAIVCSIIELIFELGYLLQIRLLWQTRMPIPWLWAFSIVLSVYWIIVFGVSQGLGWREAPITGGIMGVAILIVTFSCLKCRFYVLDWRKQEYEAADDVPGLVEMRPIGTRGPGERPARDDDSIMTPPPVYDGTFEPPGYSR
ncbi:hypothetical protein KVT40_008519 [Elsinoe batatas]|uniref:Uncharacterized protein n=1 Tax=Elsinoe batatas TaxID=2601811 RepID=A0A8K0L0F9_9PEZI|nr:hypothetical protein KVT40_008519 [Elsinoe batatas]